MAAGLGFKTFTTGEVLTAADTNGYLMQGVNVFADAAARTAAITSPQEGQMSYLKDTNATEYYTGSAWTSLAPAASGGMTLISTTTLTGASITLSSIPSTYNNLELIVQNYRPATDLSLLYMRVNSDSNTRYSTRTAVNGVGSSFGSTEFNIAPTTTSANYPSLIQVSVPNYANATTWKMIRTQSLVNNDGLGTDFSYYNAVGGYYNQTTAISSITLFPSGGNFTSGTVLLYGVK